MYPRHRRAGLAGSSCSASAPSSDLPWDLVPDVLNLDACVDCVTLGDAGRQGYQTVFVWRDSNTLPGAVNPRNNRVVNFDWGERKARQGACCVRVWGARPRAQALTQVSRVAGRPNR